MGIIRAAKNTISGMLADSWLEVYEAEDMSDQTVFTRGVPVRKGQNRKGSKDTISNGSVIHVYPNQFMLLTDGGRIVDYTAEEGYYEVNDSSLPSLFNGEFRDTLEESFQRLCFGGQTPTSQKVCFINLQEIKGIKFGTRNPVNYFDNFYNAELFLRTHGTYSIKITDPLKFYAEVIAKDKNRVDITSINEQYLHEFLEALQSALNQMSADGIRISHVTSKSRELGRYMADVLDAEWNHTRGMEIQAVGIASITYDEESKKLINLRNQGAMLSDASIREGYVQGAMARGMEAAGSNRSGAMAGLWHEYGDADRRQLYGGCFCDQCRTDAEYPGRGGQLDLRLRHCQYRKILLRMRTAKAGQQPRLDLLLRHRQYWEILFRLRKTKARQQPELDLLLRHRQHWQILFCVRAAKARQQPRLDLLLRHYQHGQILFCMRAAKAGQQPELDLLLRHRQYGQILFRLWKTKALQQLNSRLRHCQYQNIFSLRKTTTILRYIHVCPYIQMSKLRRFSDLSA